MRVFSSSNVFVNCPFDEAYNNIFNAVIFTVLDCGYNPRCSLELSNGAENRLNKILRLIKECRLSIHDISRIELDKKHNLPRFNMPFELGLFFGAKHYGHSKQRNKSCLIMEGKQYDSQKFLSDLAGHDLCAHKNDFKLAIKGIRIWLQGQTKKNIILPGVKSLLSRYKKFQLEKPLLCKKLDLSSTDLDFITYSRVVKRWIEVNTEANNQ